ncbi:MAG: MFS transporter [Lautropia sp. SCN 66-9]|nr:MAG: MFS transporter [Lautropia sp. SCN 66-9]
MILACALIVLLLAMGVRATFGLFMQPMGLARGWSREVFSIAFAIQNLVWGITAPLAGIVADKFGSGRTVAFSALVYALGLAGMTQAESSWMLYLYGGVLVGLGQAGTTFGILLGVVGRAFEPAKRSAAIGLASAGGSLGQFVLMPVGSALIGALDWHLALWALAAISLLPLILAPVLSGRPDPAPSGSGPSGSDVPLMGALREAVGDRTFHLLFWSFFVCGFHTAFITLHLPSFVVDQGLNLTHGAMAVAVIGLFNVLGSWGAGYLGGRFSKRGLLVWLYTLRAGSIAILLAFALSPLTLYLFAATMGLLWLGTVPLTNGLVGQIYGMRYVSTLYGLIFLGHQLGSVIGVWLGGWTYERTGSYDLMWWLGIALALAAGAVSRPIDERPLYLWFGRCYG